MSSDQASTAVWDHLPPINDRVRHTITEADTVKQEDLSKLNQSQDVAMLKPSQKHMQTIEGKRAMLIMDTCISKVLLVSAFPQIVANIQHYELLLGREVKLLFKEYEKVSTEYETVINAPPKKKEPNISCEKAREVSSSSN